MATICLICQYVYNDGDRKPLLLPCGHSFCKVCLLQSPMGYKACFLCRLTWNGNVKDLPVCYQLIPDATDTQARGHDSRVASLGSACPKHTHAFEFWCVTCYRELCKKCLFEEHKQCETYLSDDVLEKHDGILVGAAKVLRKRTAVNLNAVQKPIVRTSNSLERVKKLLNVVMNSKALLENETSNLERKRAANQEILRCLDGYDTSNMMREQKLDVMRMSTKSLLDAQKEIRLSDEQRRTITSLCSFADGIDLTTSRMMQAPVQRLREVSTLQKIRDAISDATVLIGLACIAVFSYYRVYSHR